MEYEDVTAPGMDYNPRNAALQKAAYAARDASRAPQTDEPPFTSRSMQFLVATTDNARQTMSRLYELRDRLFGPSPTNALGSAGIEKQVPPMGFADAYGRQANELSITLGEIERLTLELSNRL